ncbi:MAG: ATP synthase F1 subunit gamma [Candidatus Wallbacteria bacterium GWC2_49_35]|uniref:ATP synthase gamma chain n=1 Tax=Candidatus Wallbacteria bacterium GWC2_49_35 TaxID=1817813 RepID=A0A1F7WR78_9BACT|nr:MAG: ATP synthase F1 subunit gamma [Candidatus Wallbacteria bacterium GWC2_49_35]HBC74505.1 ATP synthase F1 subunit gamma [Candidatus Wallbacteria bacterium]
MKQAKEIKRKIKSIISIQHITRAMKMVSAAKFKRAQVRLTGISAYFKRIKEMIAEMAAYLSEHKHPFVMSEAEKAEAPRVKCLVVVTGDKGLCGSFNINICKEAEYIAKSAKIEGYETLIITVGTKGYDYLKKRGYKVIFNVPLNKPDPKFDDIEAVVDEVLRVYDSGTSKDIHVLYTHYVSTITYKIAIEKILPLDFNRKEFASAGAAASSVANDFKFEPNASDILNYLLPRYIKMLLFDAIVESSCSEQGTRMITMGSATDKASEIIGELTLILNRARQESITAEILDIVGGVNALKK